MKKEDEFFKDPKLKKAQEIILNRIKRSLVPEDYNHAINTLKWLVKLCSFADDRMKIAALAHDIERAYKDKKIKRENYSDFNEFKRAHAENSAKIVRSILTDLNFSKDFIDDVCELIKLHEFGGNKRADCIKDADSISFFDTNLVLYYQREGFEETKRRAIWGYKRLSDRAKMMVKTFTYQDKKLQELINSLRYIIH